MNEKHAVQTQVSSGHTMSASLLLGALYVPAWKQERGERLEDVPMQRARLGMRDAQRARAVPPSFGGATLTFREHNQSHWPVGDCLFGDSD
jgi:hypothetical protein